MEPLKIKKTVKPELPQWILDAVEAIKPHIDAGTEFVCLVVDPNIGHADPGKVNRDDEKSITICNASSAKNTFFLTDGTYVDQNKVRYKDGVVCDRIVKGWHYIVLENVRQDANQDPRVKKTVYTRDKWLHLALRQAVGLHGW